MNSKVEILNYLEDDVLKKKIAVEPGDIVMFKDIKANKTYMARVVRPSLGKYCFYVLGERLVYEINYKEIIRADDIATITNGDKIKIIGVCDIDITIKEIKKY